MVLIAIFQSPDPFLIPKQAVNFQLMLQGQGNIPIVPHRVKSVPRCIGETPDVFKPLTQRS